MKQQPATRKATQAPLYHAYSVKEAAGDRAKAHWTKIGAFFPHEDGEGGTSMPCRSATASCCVPRKPMRRGVAMQLLTKELQDRLLANARQQLPLRGTEAELDFLPRHRRPR